MHMEEAAAGGQKLTAARWGPDASLLATANEINHLIIYIKRFFVVVERTIVCRTSSALHMMVLLLFSLLTKLKEPVCGLKGAAAPPGEQQ